MDKGGATLDFRSLDRYNSTRWNRIIMNVFWMVIAISAMVSLIYMLKHDDQWDFFIHFVLFPTGILLGLTLAMELLFRRYGGEISFGYLIILTATAIASTLISVHYAVDTIWGTLVLPLLVSCIYYKRNKILFAFFSSLSALFIMYSFHGKIQGEISFIDLITMIAILFGGVVVAIGVMRRGLEILKHLQETLVSSQDLMAKKILMEKMAKTDALTGLDNHLAFHQYLDHLLEHGDEGDLSIHLALLDIDNFKQINDTYGHHVGDTILKFVAHYIKAGASQDDFVARYGGEEFAIIFVDKPLHEVHGLLETIRKSIADVPHNELQNQRVTLSIGLGEYIPGEGKNGFFEKADNALYAAKRTGKNKLNVFSPLDSANSAY
jgi:diguanylate cyclase (GGDEF)-like protein